MKTTLAQAATFALSAVGALAILVGVLDQPRIAASAAGTPTAMLAAAASTPMVGRMA